MEVKSGRSRNAFSGMEAFRNLFNPLRTLLVGSDGIPLEEFLSSPVTRWLKKQREGIPTVTVLLNQGFLFQAFVRE